MAHLAAGGNSADRMGQRDFAFDGNFTESTQCVGIPDVYLMLIKIFSQLKSAS